MTTTATTAVQTGQHPFLGRGETFRFEGKRYLVLDRLPKNYDIVNESGKRYRLNRNSLVTLTGKDDAWLARIEASEGNFAEGDPVIITAQGRWQGQKALVCKINPVSIDVVIRKVGVLRVGKASIRADENA
jgi:hypothetical protein